MGKPQVCWCCKKASTFTEKVDKEHGDMVYYQCTVCKATSGLVTPKKRRK